MTDHVATIIDAIKSDPNVAPAFKDALPATAKSNPVHTADRDSLRFTHAELIAKLAAIRPPRLWLEPDPEDIEAYGEYERQILEAIKEHHGKVCEFVAMNGAGNLDDVIGFGDAALSDMQSDFEGSMNSAAAKMRGDDL